MQRDPHYHDVVAEVHAFLRARAETALEAGVREVWVDPGIGFGKTASHNLALLHHLPELVAEGFPVLVGTSRKRFSGLWLRAPSPSPPAWPTASGVHRHRHLDHARARRWFGSTTCRAWAGGDPRRGHPYGGRRLVGPGTGGRRAMSATGRGYEGGPTGQRVTGQRARARGDR